MNKSIIVTYRMQICSGCKAQHDNEDCYGSDDDIEACIDAAYEAEEP